MAFQAFIFNNTNNDIKLLVMGPLTEARFLLGPNTVAPISLSPGLKALVAFANGALVAMRPIRATAQFQVFAVNPNQTLPSGPEVRVAAAPEPDDISIDGLS